MDYFLYARKSTDIEDKQIRSIEDQLSVLRSLAKQGGLHIVREFTEKETAKKPGRPVFNEMMRLVEQGKAQGILCWKLDRLARNPWDDGWVRWLHQIGTIQEVRTFERDYQSEDNGLLMSIEFAAATQYVRDLAANTKRGLHEKVKRGEYPTLAPIGYLNDARYKSVVVDRVRANVVKATFELYAEGDSTLEDIAQFFAKRGVYDRHGHQFHLTRVTNILSNPFYYGHFRYAGELYEGKHKPIISKALYDKVQAVMKKRGWQDRKENDPLPLCGLIRCAECGCSITAETKVKHQKNGNVHTYVYYRCTKKRGTCSQSHIREENLSSQLSEAIKPYGISQDLAAELSKLADKDEENALQSSAAASQATRDELTAVSLKLKRLRALYLDEDIERESFIEGKDELLSRKKSLEEEMAALSKGVVAWLEPLRGWVKDAEELNNLAETAPLHAKKSYAKKIFGTNLFLNSRFLVSTPTPPYDALCASRKNFSENEFSQLCVHYLGDTWNQIMAELQEWQAIQQASAAYSIA